MKSRPQILEEEEEEQLLKDDGTDICDQLMGRYKASTAPQHRHLLATAVALRSILTSESLPFTPTSYFLASLNNLSDIKTLDTTAVSALLSFLGIVVPLMTPKQGIKAEKVGDVVNVLVDVVEREGLGSASVKGVMKCLGALMVGFCDLEDWDMSKLGFHTLLKFSIDKRPKVRKSAQDCLEKVFKSFQSSSVIKEASKLIHSLFKSYMPLAVEVSHMKFANDPKDGMLSRPEHLELLHMLNVVKLTVPYLSMKVNLKILSELHKLILSEFSPLISHILKIIEAFYEASKVDAILSESQKIIASLAAYVLLLDKNPADTVIAAATLLKRTLDILHAAESRSWIMHIPLVFKALLGLLTSETSSTSPASVIMKELINQHIEPKLLLVDENQSLDESEGACVIRSICNILEKSLSLCNDVPNDHVLEVFSAIFRKLGKLSSIFVKDVIPRLADFMNLASGTASGSVHIAQLQSCIGSAVLALGPEMMLSLLPISLQADGFTYSNIWLIPILKDHIVGASLEYYVEHIVPLAKSFQRASHKVRNSVARKDLQARAHALLGLLPAFCRFPVDTHQNFGVLAELIISFLKKDPSMYENIAVALQVLVNQNKSVHRSTPGEAETNRVKDTFQDHSASSYSKKIATRNLKALSSFSPELLKTLTDLFITSPPEKQSYLKDAIGCLASLNPSVTKNILVSQLERFQFIDDKGTFKKLAGDNQDTTVQGQGDPSTLQRRVILNLASALVEGAEEDLVQLMYDFVVTTFQEIETICAREAYHALSRILEEHAWFCSLRSVELVDLLFGMRLPDDAESLRYRFACFKGLMVNLLKISSEEEDTKAFRILNEIILALKDEDEGGRKVAYDVLIKICENLKSSSNITSDDPRRKLINMLLGYLADSSPQIKSGAVSALSVLVYSDADICLHVPDIISSVIPLLQSKTHEVIKAVLGFAKVLVSSLQAKDLQSFLTDVLGGILPWFSVSRHHYREKVTVVLEIMIRKCGFVSVELVTPEKYKRFIKTVLQNRRGKANSKEAGTSDYAVVGDSSENRPRKRKQEELGSQPGKNDSSLDDRRRKERRVSASGVSRPRKRKQEELGSQPGKNDGSLDDRRRKERRFSASGPRKSLVKGSIVGSRRIHTANYGKRFEHKSQGKTNSYQRRTSGFKGTARNMNKKGGGGGVHHRSRVGKKNHMDSK